MKKLTKIVTIVASLVFAMMFVNTASADVNPFAQSDQISMIDGDGEKKCGDGEKKCGDGEKKCGDKKKGDKKCGDGEKKCGDGEKKCGDGEKKCGDKKKGDKKCGESKCGGK